MRSTLSGTNRTEIQKKEVRQVEFCEFNFPGGAVRISTADRDLTWGGFSWLANGTLVDPGSIEETAELETRRIAFKLSGLDPTVISRIMTDNYLFATVKCYVGWCDENWVLVADPHPLGETLLMSNAVVTLDTESSIVELSSETWALFGDRDSAVLATPQSQKLRYAGDTGQDRMAYILTQMIEWGGVPQHAGGSVAGGGPDPHYPVKPD